MVQGIRYNGIRFVCSMWTLRIWYKQGLQGFDLNLETHWDRLENNIDLYRE